MYKRQEIYLLDKEGALIRDADLNKNAVFVLGDHEGIPKQERKEIEKISRKVSLGKVMYFASQSLSVLQNELDLRAK